MPLTKLCNFSGATATVKGACPYNLAVDSIFRRELEHVARRISEQSQKTISVRSTQDGLHDLGHHPHAGVYKSDIAARCSKPDFDGLHDGNVNALLPQVERSRQPRVSAADNQHIGAQITAQLARRWSGRRCLSPQAMRVSRGNQDRCGPSQFASTP